MRVEGSTLSEDLALQLDPDDIGSGLRKIEMMLTRSEELLDRRILKLQAAWPAVTVFALATGFLHISGKGPILGVFSLAWMSALSIMAAVLMARAPDIVQQLPEKLQLRLFPDDPNLAPIRAYLAKLCEDMALFIDERGHQVEWDFLRSRWAIFLFSSKQRFRKVPIHITTSGIVRYSEQLRLVARVQPKLQESKDSVQEDTLSSPVINEVSLTGKRAQNVEPAERSQCITDRPRKPTKPPSVKPRHWLGTIKPKQFEARLPKILKHWNGRSASQVEFVLRFAFNYAHEHTSATKGQLLSKAAAALTDAQLPIGLDGGDSTEWIDKMLGVQLAHPYRFVREILTDPKSEFSRRFLAQEKLEL